MATLRVKAGADFTMTSPYETPAVFMIRPEAFGNHMIVAERWETEPFTPFHDYTDMYGNVCRRMTLPAGNFELRYDTIVESDGDLDPVALDAVEHPISELPDDALVYTLPSRFCLSDVIFPRAMELFGGMQPGWSRVQAICDFVHRHLKFGYGSSTSLTTAIDVYESGAGVCRDYAHLAITFCRALNIPARYSFGYMPDIDVPPPYDPMDFCAWFEVYLGGKWWIFDARNNVRRRARITIARGRDALDVAMLTTYGPAKLDTMVVRADRTEDHVRTLA
ncbi:MAG: transglutaminase family protein [Candidatus Eremiobacteraeota bacterium]|nr:transglutaminase family protein [Candidatus Eremiobacteraeota bacterium]